VVIRAQAGAAAFQDGVDRDRGAMEETAPQPESGEAGLADAVLDAGDEPLRRGQRLAEPQGAPVVSSKAATSVKVAADVGGQADGGITHGSIHGLLLQSFQRVISGTPRSGEPGNQEQQGLFPLLDSGFRPSAGPGMTAEKSTCPFHLMHSISACAGRSVMKLVRRPAWRDEERQPGVSRRRFCGGHTAGPEHRHDCRAVSAAPDRRTGGFARVGADLGWIAQVKSARP